MDRRQFTRREIDRKNEILMAELKAEVTKLSQPPCPIQTPSKPPSEVWIARIEGRVIAVTHTRQNMIDFLKENCQFFDIRTEDKNRIYGDLRWKQATESFDVSIYRYPIRYPSQSSVHTERKG